MGDLIQVTVGDHWSNMVQELSDRSKTLLEKLNKKHDEHFSVTMIEPRPDGLMKTLYHYDPYYREDEAQVQAPKNISSLCYWSTKAPEKEAEGLAGICASVLEPILLSDVTDETN